MIIQYNRSPYASIEEKLQSLAESVQLALNEKANEDEVQRLKEEIQKLQRQINQ